MRGAILNLTLQHTRAALYRGVLEGLSFCLRENLEAWRARGLAPKVLRVLGGGAVNDLWQQMQADVTGMPIERPVVTEAAVFGAAMLAMSGHDPTIALKDISARNYRAGRLFTPNPAVAEAYTSAYQRYLQALEP